MFFKTNDNSPNDTIKEIFGFNKLYLYYLTTVYGSKIRSKYLSTCSDQIIGVTVSKFEPNQENINDQCFAELKKGIEKAITSSHQRYCIDCSMNLTSNNFLFGSDVIYMGNNESDSIFYWSDTAGDDGDYVKNNELYQRAVTQIEQEKQFIAKKQLSLEKTSTEFKLNTIAENLLDGIKSTALSHAVIIFIDNQDKKIYIKDPYGDKSKYLSHYEVLKEKIVGWHPSYEVIICKEQQQHVDDHVNCSFFSLSNMSKFFNETDEKFEDLSFINPLSIGEQKYIKIMLDLKHDFAEKYLEEEMTFELNKIETSRVENKRP